MQALVVTNKHGNIGKVVEVTFTDISQHVVDDEGKLYHHNDICDIDTLEHEYDKSIKLSNYWRDVARTIQRHWGGNNEQT